MTPQPQPDYTFVPTGFPPAPEGWYYPHHNGIRVAGDRTVYPLTDRYIPGKIADCSISYTIGFPIITDEDESRVIRRIPAAPVAKPEAHGRGSVSPRGAHPAFDDTDAPDYPAGLPPGLVKVEGGPLMVGDYGIGEPSGSVYPIDSVWVCMHPTVESWCKAGGKSAVYRAPAPEAKPKAGDQKITYTGSVRPCPNAVEWNGEWAALGHDDFGYHGGAWKCKKKCPICKPMEEAKPPTDHSGEANEMVHHVGEANEMIHAPTCPTHIDSRIECERGANGETFTKDEGPLCVACGEVRMKLRKPDVYPSSAWCWRCDGCGLITPEYIGKDEAKAKAAAIKDAPRLHARAMAANEHPRVVAHIDRLMVLNRQDDDRKAALTAENTRLAGEYAEMQKEVQAVKSEFCEVVKERDDARAELARLKAPVDVEEFAGITPGDWVMSPGPDGSFEIYTASGEKIDFVIASRNPCKRRATESLANGRLFMAAPRLLRELVETRAELAKERTANIDLIATAKVRQDQLFDAEKRVRELEASEKIARLVTAESGAIINRFISDDDLERARCGPESPRRDHVEYARAFAGRIGSMIAAARGGKP